jgi:hypothetical protein
MTDTKKLVTNGALAAFFTALGAIGASVFNNWDHIFGHPNQGGQSISAKGGRDVITNTGDTASAGNVNGNLIQNNKGTVNIGKGSEFYKKNGIRINMPVALSSKHRARIHVLAANESERRINHFELLMFEGQKVPGALVTRSPDVSIGPKETTPPWLFNVTSAPDSVVLCASYDADAPGKFVTLTVPAEKNVVPGLIGDRYRTTGNWNIFYSDKFGDCDQKGKIEPIATTEYFG